MERYNAYERKIAFGSVILFGIVSLFADITYKGARGLYGPFLALLGASGAFVGMIAGVGGLAGYGLRLISGYLADKMKRYWAITFLGYSVNLLAVPLLALTHHPDVAAFLIIAERTGKAIRTPARDVLLSHATASIGRGFGFGLHQAPDQGGAIVGPLVVSLAIYHGLGYSTAFANLSIPAILALLTLLVVCAFAHLSSVQKSVCKNPSVIPKTLKVFSAFFFHVLFQGPVKCQKLHTLSFATCMATTSL